MANAFHSQLPFAAERYVLDELSEAEKLEFEDHFFSCETCAQDVEDLTTIRLAVRGEAPKLVRKPKWWSTRSWMPWLLTNRFAFAALAVVVMFGGYQNFVQIPHLKAEADDTFAAIAAPKTLSAKRASGSNRISRQVRSAPLLIANEWPENYPAYHAALSRHGSEKALFQTDLGGVGDILLVTVPARRLGVGNFDLVILGKPSQGEARVVGRYVVTIEGE